MKVNAYSTHGNLVGTVEVGQKKHSTGYTYKVYGEFTPIKQHKGKKNG